METILEAARYCSKVYVRFHLGSGINGNLFYNRQRAEVEARVRFHLGSGINGN